MQQPRLTIVILFVAAAFIIIGCRVENAGNEERDPTPADRIISINFDDPTPTDDLGFVPTQEVVEDTTTQVAQDISPTATSTATDAIPTNTLSPTPSFTPDFRAGQGGSFATFTSVPTEVAIGQNNTFPTATATATNTPTSTPTDTPTNTPTDTPTNTPTNTPTDTPTNTPTDTPTTTPSLTATATIPVATSTQTPFPPDAIGGGPNDVPTEVAQDATLNPQQLTATAFILQVTQNAAATAGLPTQTPQFDPSGGSDTTGVTPTPPPVNNNTTDSGTTDTSGQQGSNATSFPDCEEFIDPGETLSQIARTYNIDEDDLANYNQITNKDFIEAGDYLTIPGCGRNPTPTPSPDPAGPNSTQVGPPQDPDNSLGPVTYVVQAGDSIYNLSVRFGVTMSALWNANRSAVPDINVISEGQQLTIPQRTQPVDDTATSTPAPTG